MKKYRIRYWSGKTFEDKILEGKSIKDIHDVKYHASDVTKFPVFRIITKVTVSQIKPKYRHITTIKM